MPQGAALHPSKAALAEQCYASAYQALEDGDDRVAQRFFLLMALCAPRDERAWVGLGVCHEREGSSRLLPRTAAVYTIGARLVGESAWLQLGRGRALAKLGRYHDALIAFDAAEDAAADNPALLQAIREERP